MHRHQQPVDCYSRPVETMNRLVPAANYFNFDQAAAPRIRIPLPDAHLTMGAHNQGDELALMYFLTRSFSSRKQAELLKGSATRQGHVAPAGRYRSPDSGVARSSFPLSVGRPSHRPTQPRASTASQKPSVR